MVGVRLGKLNEANFEGDIDLRWSLGFIDTVGDPVGSTEPFDACGCSISSIGVAGARLGKCDGAMIMGGNDLGMPLGLIDIVGDLVEVLVGFIDTFGNAAGSTELLDDSGC
jgi:hypothetical protein